MQNQNPLASAITLPNGTVIKNRLFKSAMSENMSSRNHAPNHKHIKLYETLAKGGIGINVTGNIMIDSRALGEPNNVVIEKNHEHYDLLKQWATKGTQNNTHLWGQLNHPGKQSPKFLSPTPVAPSAIGYAAPMSLRFNKPRELNHEEILDLIERFAYAAKVLKETGFSGVQIHGAHGYLVSQFLSPLHNQRNDQWGGSPEKRMAFVLAIYRRIREEVGKDFPIGIKLNSADFQKGGFSEEESMNVVIALAKAGIDLIEISGGTYEAPKMMGAATKSSTLKREAYFIDYVEKLRNKVETPLVLTGGFRTAKGMKEAITSGATDMIGLGRSLAVDPNFPEKILTENNAISPVHPLTTGFAKVDRSFPLEIIWYTYQLQRIGEGKKSVPNLTPWIPIASLLLNIGVNGLRRVRA